MFHGNRTLCIDKQGYRGNMSIPSTTPRADASTEEGKAEDTDFGAVMYITAVLIFYSLGIVVMIIKYLKTERKEMEEELILENFFKGIPSKKIEHEQEAVNRVAIRAFHTLTSGATWQDQLPITIESSKQVSEITDSYSQVQNECSVSTDDSDSTKEDCSSRLLQRERSKYLPRVSLMFRQSRSSDQRKFRDSMRSNSSQLRSNSSQFPQDMGMCEGQRCSHPTSQWMKSSKADGCFEDSNKQFDHTEDSTESQTDSNRLRCGDSKHVTLQNHFGRLQNKNTSRGVGVRFQDDEGIGEKNVSSGRDRVKARSLSRTFGKVNVNKEHPLTSSFNDTCTSDDMAISETTLDGWSLDQVDRPVSSTAELPEGMITQSSQATDSDSDDVDAESLVSPRRLLVSDV